MNKDEILAKSREENKNGDEREKTSRIKSSAISAAVGALLCMIFMIVEELVFDRHSIHLWIIYFGIQFTSNLLEYIEIKRRATLFACITFGIGMLLWITIYILECVGA